MTDVQPGSMSMIVSQVSPLRVSVIGQSAKLPAKYLASYTPALNDLVAVIPLDTSRRLVLGKITG